MGGKGKGKCWKVRLYRGLIEEVRICEASGMHSTRVQNRRYKYGTTDLDQRNWGRRCWQWYKRYKGIFDIQNAKWCWPMRSLDLSGPDQSDHRIKESPDNADRGKSYAREWSWYQKQTLRGLKWIIWSKRGGLPGRQSWQEQIRWSLSWSGLVVKRDACRM